MYPGKLAAHRRGNIPKAALAGTRERREDITSYINLK